MEIYSIVVLVVVGWALYQRLKETITAVQQRLDKREAEHTHLNITVARLQQEVQQLREAARTARIVSPPPQCFCGARCGPHCADCARTNSGGQAANPAGFASTGPAFSGPAFNAGTNFYPAGCASSRRAYPSRAAGRSGAPQLGSSAPASASAGPADRGRTDQDPASTHDPAPARALRASRTNLVGAHRTAVS